MELERTTANQTQALKEKIGAKKTEKAIAAPAPVAPTEPAKPTETAGAAASVVQPATTAPTPATVIEPAATVKAEPKVTDEQRKKFLAAAQAKAIELNASDETAKSKMREMLFNLGCTRFVDLPASQFDAIMKAVEEWK
jgi:hypothetical protein